MNPFRDFTYAQSISYLADRHGSREAISFRDQRFSFRDLKHHVDRASARLASLGLVAGDKVAILLPNRPEFIWYWFGAAQMGLVAVMLNGRLRRDELAYQLGQSDSRAVFIACDGSRDFLAELSELLPKLRTGKPGELGSERLPLLDNVIAIDPVGSGYPGALDWSRPASQDYPMPTMETDPAKAALIAYSSGTTALPKGAMITHCVWRKAWDAGERVELTEDDCLYMAVPMFGSMAHLNGVLPYLVRGARQVIGEQFDAGACLRSIAKDRVTGIHLLPPTIKQLIEHPDFPASDRSSLRIGYVLSADPTILDTVSDVIGVPGVMTGYGLTETTTLCTRNLWTDPREIRHHTQGWALPDVEIQIFDPETLKPRPTGERGEIWVRSYCNMLGYYKKPKETADVLRPDGWLRTGDLGELDEDGRIRFLGRVGDGYKSRGFNVSPEEVEHVIVQHADVEAASVVGIPHPVADQVGAAFVIRKPGAALTTEELHAFLKPRLAGYKTPAHLFFVDSFPLTPGTGKVQKFKLREMARERLRMDGPAPASVTEERAR